jgi:hypothetical protein
LLMDKVCLVFFALLYGVIGFRRPPTRQSFPSVHGACLRERAVNMHNIAIKNLVAGVR